MEQKGPGATGRIEQRCVSGSVTAAATTFAASQSGV